MILAPEGRPVITEAYNTSSTSIRLAWRPPPKKLLHGEFLSYKLTYWERYNPKKSSQEFLDVKARVCPPLYKLTFVIFLNFNHYWRRWDNLNRSNQKDMQKSPSHERVLRLAALRVTLSKITFCICSRGVHVPNFRSLSFLVRSRDAKRIDRYINTQIYQPI